MKGQTMLSFTAVPLSTWRKSSLYLLLLISANTTILHVGGLLAVDPYPFKLSSGIQRDEIKGLVFYESFVPFIYEFKVPAHSAKDITFIKNCATDNSSQIDLSCPVFYHFNQFLEQFVQYVIPNVWTTTNQSASPIRELTDFCNKIQPHFKGSLTEELEFQDYLKKLMLCLYKETKVDIESMVEKRMLIEDHAHDAMDALIVKMKMKYLDTFPYELLDRSSKRTSPALHVSAGTTHQYGILIPHLMEKVRWVDTINSCKNGRAPEMLSLSPRVTNDLKGLNTRLALSNQKFAFDPKQTSAIFKLPLTDCTFINGPGNFVVRLLIPVIGETITPKLYTISTFPLILEDQMCQLNLNLGAGKFLHDGNNRIYISQCSQTDPLCQVTPLKGLVTDPCLNAVFFEDFSLIRTHCNVKCFEIPKSELSLKMPIVQQIDSDAWAFVGVGMNHTVVGRITCGLTFEEKVDLSQKLTGGLQVKLPCRCEMTVTIYNSARRKIQKEEVLRPTHPCSEEASSFPEIRQILLPHFLRKEVLDKDKGLLNVTMESFDMEFLHSSGRNDVQKQQGDGDDEESLTFIRDTYNGDKIAFEHQLAALWTIVIFLVFIILSVIALGVYSKYKVSYSKERLFCNIHAPSTTSDQVNLNESCSL